MHRELQAVQITRHPLAICLAEGKILQCCWQKALPQLLLPYLITYGKKIISYSFNYCLMTLFISVPADTFLPTNWWNLQYTD